MIQRTDTDARVGANIKALRKARGWSQWQLGRFARVAAESVSNFETGARPVPAEKLKELARALGTTVETLSGGRVSAEEVSRLRSKPQVRSHEETASLAEVDVAGAEIRVEEKRGAIKIVATILPGYDARVVNNACAELQIRVRRLGFVKDLERDANPRGNAVEDEEDEAA